MHFFSFENFTCRKNNFDLKKTTKAPLDKQIVQIKVKQQKEQNYTISTLKGPCSNLKNQSINKDTPNQENGMVCERCKVSTGVWTATFLFIFSSSFLSIILNILLLFIQYCELWIFCELRRLAEELETCRQANASSAWSGLRRKWHMYIYIHMYLFIYFLQTWRVTNSPASSERRPPGDDMVQWALQHRKVKMKSFISNQQDLKFNSIFNWKPM